MTKSQLDLFPTKKNGNTSAPESLTPQQEKKIRDWAERIVPWVSRGAFDSFTTIDSFVDEVLEWWGGAGRRKSDWVKTIQTRIRKLERDRLAVLAKRGNEDAKLALRDPGEWARRYDRKQQATRFVSSSGGEDLISPMGGTVLKLMPPGKS